jgi:aspartate kinase
LEQLNQRLRVEKIGGTSMSAFSDVLNSIVLKGEANNRIFVVSAYSGITNVLLENKKTREPGIYRKFENQEAFEESIEALKKQLFAINENFQPLKLDVDLANDFIGKRIDQSHSYLNSMREVIASGYVEKANILLAARELLASIGEAHSAFNTTNIIQNHGIKAKFIDLSGFHDREYLTINERISKAFKGIDLSDSVAVATGYTKGTEGIMREFDRGYSEITFSKIAVEVGVSEAIIHKEYHLCSADPNVVGIDHAIPVGLTNYDVADQLADVGMEAIHPKASKPIELAGINLRIKNTFDPDHPGTLITNDYVGKESKVEVITGTDRAELITVHDSRMVGEVGYDLAIMTIFKQFNVSYILKATNANSISMVVWESSKNTSLIKALQDKYQYVLCKKVAMLCVIGSNITKPQVLVTAASALSAKNIPIECVSLASRQVNVQFVIERPYFNRSVRTLHQAFAEDFQ